jgi:hypothetical protein
MRADYTHGASDIRRDKWPVSKKNSTIGRARAIRVDHEEKDEQTHGQFFARARVKEMERRKERRMSI